MKHFLIQSALWGGLEGCVYVALDGKIYSFGGSFFCDSNRREDSIKIIDIKDTTQVLRMCRMKRARYGPQVAELDKKIYIFGGQDAKFIGGKNMESAEVFDVARGRCELLPDGFGRGYRLIGVDRRRKRIMFLPGKEMWRKKNSSAYLSRWDTETGCKLNCLSKKIGYTNRVLVGTTLYWVSDYGFHSYDFEKRVSGDTHKDDYKLGFYRDFDFDFDSAVSMFHMYRDVFCLVIEDQDCRYGTLYWMAVSISISNTILPDYGDHKLDLKVLHADLYTTPDGSSFREIPALVLYLKGFYCK